MKGAICRKTVRKVGRTLVVTVTGGFDRIVTNASFFCCGDVHGVQVDSAYCDEK